MDPSKVYVVLYQQGQSSRVSSLGLFIYGLLKIENIWIYGIVVSIQDTYVAITHTSHFKVEFQL